MAMLEERTTSTGMIGGKKEPSLQGKNPSRGQRDFRNQVQSPGQAPSHRLNMIDRETMTVTGVRDVMSFDESEILLETGMGMLTICGSDLHVNRLTLEKGEVDVVGKINSLTYADVGTYKRQGESLLSRLFR